MVCLFVGLVCFFLSYSFLKFNGTPPVFHKRQTRVDCKTREAGEFASWLVRTD